MSDVSPITIAFLERRPAAAARALSALDPEAAADFLNQTPTRHVVEVFNHAGAWSASLWLRRMELSSASALLRQSDYRQAVSILRLVPGEQRTGLLNGAPARLRRDLSSSLSFSEVCVGAHMTTRILAMTHRQTVAEACREMKRAAAAQTESGLVFVTDKQRRLMGAVSAGELLRSEPASALEMVMDGSINRISSRSRIPTVLHLPAWDQYSLLPVISRRRHLIGALPRAALREWDARRGADVLSPDDSIPRALAGAFLSVSGELARLLVEAPATLETRIPRKP